MFPIVPYYRILSLANSGGMANVYRALDLRSSKIVAIKHPFPQCLANPNIINHFRERVNYYLYLNHPNIVKLVDFVAYKNDYFIVMEYIDGISLNDYIEKIAAPLTPSNCFNIIMNVLSAMDYMHSKEILHLDIKPGNIMLTRNNTIKMIDLGISSKICDVQHVESRSGSPLYMSPEQITKNPLGRYTDIYAIGIVLYCMLTKRHPFQGKNNDEIFYNILNKPIPNVCRLNPSVNADIQRILEKATAKHPQDRYQNCSEFAMDFRNAIKNRQSNIPNHINQNSITI